MSKPFSYNKNSEHVLLPYKDKKMNDKRIDYIGTVVLRDFRKGVNVAKFGVYFMKDWTKEKDWINCIGKSDSDMVWLWKEQLANAVDTANGFLNNAHNSPDTMKPIFDCHTIAVFAGAGYYFVDETDKKSLRCFNILWHKEVIKTYYRGCDYFCSERRNMDVEYKNGIPVNEPLKRF